MPRKNGDKLYPSLRREVIDVLSDVSPHELLKFPSHLKGKRKDDLVVFGIGKSDRLSEISVYENPRNRDLDEGITDDSQLNHWSRLSLQSIRLPSSSIPVDISGNGFFDLIITSDYGESLDKMDPYGGRVCWLENFGTGEGDWTRRDIGRYPGINCIKVGHFSTTFSLQVLAIVKSSRSEVHAPLIVFTRPDDVYKPQPWLVNITLENAFTAIQDCIVINGATGVLDHVIISSREGLTIVWYRDRSWHHKPLCCSEGSDRTHLPGQMGAGKINYDRFAYIAIAEVNKGSVLSLYTKTRTMPGQAFTEIVWRYTILDDFANIQCGASIIDILCVDLDGDGVDEIIVSVASEGQKAGIYCYVLASTRFVKFKLSNEAAIKLTPGHFVKKDRVDLASVTGTMPGEIAIHYHSFVPSQIRPFIEDSNLIFSVPRFASSVCEVDVIDVAGFVISLVILPPNASFDIASDETEAVKVLHGALGWINSDSELIERARAAGLPGCVTSMLVDSPDGHVRSGNDGAVFVCMKPSRATDDTNLRGLNVLPSYFPCEVCEFEFKWQRDEQQVGGKDAGTKDLFHLPGFQVCFEDTRKRIASIGSNNNTCADIAYLHFWAAAPGVSSGFSRHSVSSWTIAPASSSKAGQETEQRRTAATTCTIRASLSNSGGDGGLLYCTGRFDWGVATPTSYQLSRARKMVLPAMHEHGPFWRARRAEEIENADGVDLEAVDVEYPWHAWVASRAGRKGKKKWDVWASFDFPTFITQDIDESNHKSCIIY